MLRIFVSTDQWTK